VAAFGSDEASQAELSAEEKAELSPKVCSAVCAAISNEEGWVNLAGIGEALKGNGIDVKLLGFQKILPFLEQFPELLELKHEPTASGKAWVAYARLWENERREGDGKAEKAAAKAVDGGAGVLFLYGNYGGDVFNFDLAVDLLELDGIETRTVLGCDDVASQPKERAKDRRGVAGIFFAYKAAGAAAERGDSLDEVAAVAQKVVDNTATMGVGLSPTILPTTGAASFDLPEGEMEIGIGIHGEPGIHRGPLGTADEIADQILDSVIPDLGLAEGDRVAVLVNGLGATPLEELYLLYRRTHQRLEELGVVIERRYIGEYATSLEMAGASISLLKVDDELLELLDAPAQSPFFREA